MYWACECKLCAIETFKSFIEIEIDYQWLCSTLMPHLLKSSRPTWVWLSAAPAPQLIWDNWAHFSNSVAVSPHAWKSTSGLCLTCTEGGADHLDARSGTLREFTGPLTGHTHTHTHEDIYNETRCQFPNNLYIFNRKGLTVGHVSWVWFPLHAVLHVHVHF